MISYVNKPFAIRPRLQATNEPKKDKNDDVFHIS